MSGEIPEGETTAAPKTPAAPNGAAGSGGAGATAAVPAQKVGTLGTFGGVFTPSILTILGVVMFLLVPQVTGKAGIHQAILAILIAHSVSVLTSLSLAVIATNTKVKGGGDYYLISRSLGLEFGGAIGTVLYIAQSVSVGFYVVGFTLALKEVVGGLAIDGSLFGMDLPGWFPAITDGQAERAVSITVVMLLFGLAYKGADIATRFQYVIMAALVLAIGSFTYGAVTHFDFDLLSTSLGGPTDEVRQAAAEAMNAVKPGSAFRLEDYGFWAIFAVFFPAVTGFTQGVSMSGELKDPAKSLPLGTFLAVFVGLGIYLALPFLIGGSVDRVDQLIAPGAAAMKQNALVPWLIDAGVFAATLSSALASLMGAPRILRAMAVDNIFPGSDWFAQGGNGEPRRPMLLTLAIALVCIVTGELEVLAAIVAMFFLLSYGALNFATFMECFSRNPSFRPRFRWSGLRVSLLGALVCGGVMLAINPLATVIAFAVLWSLHWYLVRRGLDSPAGDARRGFYVQRIKDYLIKLDERPSHARTWRPVVCAITRQGESGRPLARIASAIGSAQGVLTLAVVLVGKFDEELCDERRRQLGQLRKFVRSGEMSFFYEVICSDSYPRGVRSLLQVHGIGQLRPNTLLLYWSKGVETEYVDILASAALLRRNVVLLNMPDPGGPFPLEIAVDVPARDRCVDVWWRGSRNGTLALLLAHLISEHRDWRGCVIRLLRIVATAAEREAATADLEGLVDASRIQAHVHVVVDPGPPFDTIARESGGSNLVLLGMSNPTNDERKDLKRYNEILPRLPATMLVFAAQELSAEV